MNKCKHCQQKKGKRSCPALSGPICPACCGKHRQREIKCTPDCSFVQGNVEYNTKKQLGQFEQRYITFGRSLVMKHPEGAAELLYGLDASSLAYYVNSERQPTDQEMIEGWEYLLNRADSAIVVPGEKVSPFADFLLSRSNRMVQTLVREKENMKESLKEYCQFIKGFSDSSPKKDQYSSIHWKYLQSIADAKEVEKVVREYTTTPEEGKGAEDGSKIVTA